VLRQFAAKLTGCYIRCLRIKIDSGMTPTGKNNLHTNLDVTKLPFAVLQALCLLI
jgi:hypothetical protein